MHGLRRIQSIGLLYDTRTGSLVTNGRPGQLQFFSVDSGCQLFNVSILSLAPFVVRTNRTYVGHNTV